MDDVSVEVRECFADFAGSKAYLNAQDLKIACGACFAYCPSKHELRQLCDAAGINAEYVTLKDFAGIVSPRLLQRDADEMIREMFKAMDRRRRGFLALDDLRSCFADIGRSIPDQTLAEVFYEADCDDDGRVTFREFERLLSTVPTS